jgi:hypothetical protein
MRPLMFFMLVLFALTVSSAVLADGFSCDFSGTEGFCYEYSGKDWDRSSAEKACEMSGNGKFSSGECPKDDAVGVCTYELEDQPGQKVRYFFYGPNFTQEVAKMACPGEFSKP